MADGDWRQVGDQLEELGRQLRELYSAAAERAAPDRPPAEDALASFGRSVGTALDSVSEAFRDPGFTEQAKTAAESFLTALGAEVEGHRDKLARNREQDGTQDSTDVEAHQEPSCGQPAGPAQEPGEPEEREEPEEQPPAP